MQLLHLPQGSRSASFAGEAMTRMPQELRTVAVADSSFLADATAVWRRSPRSNGVEQRGTRSRCAAGERHGVGGTGHGRSAHRRTGPSQRRRLRSSSAIEAGARPSPAVPLTAPCGLRPQRSRRPSRAHRRRGLNLGAMCGIIGGHRVRVRPDRGAARGPRDPREYRGYDSAGVAIVERAGGLLVESAGRGAAPFDRQAAGRDRGRTAGRRCGLDRASTRWATHGAPDRAERASTPRTATARWRSSTTGSSRTIRELAAFARRAGHTTSPLRPTAR